MCEVRFFVHRTSSPPARRVCCASASGFLVPYLFRGSVGPQLKMASPLPSNPKGDKVGKSNKSKMNVGDGLTVFRSVGRGKGGGKVRSSGEVVSAETASGDQLSVVTPVSGSFPPGGSLAPVSVCSARGSVPAQTQLTSFSQSGSSSDSLFPEVTTASLSDCSVRQPVPPTFSSPFVSGASVRDKPPSPPPVSSGEEDRVLCARSQALSSGSGTQSVASGGLHPMQWQLPVPQFPHYPVFSQDAEPTASPYGAGGAAGLAVQGNFPHCTNSGPAPKSLWSVASASGSFPQSLTMTPTCASVSGRAPQSVTMPTAFASGGGTATQGLTLSPTFASASGSVPQSLTTSTVSHEYAGCAVQAPLYTPDSGSSTRGGVFTGGAGAAAQISFGMQPPGGFPQPYFPQPPYALPFAGWPSGGRGLSPWPVGVGFVPPPSVPSSGEALFERLASLLDRAAGSQVQAAPHHVSVSGGVSTMRDPTTPAVSGSGVLEGESLDFDPFPVSSHAVRESGEDPSDEDESRSEDEDGVASRDPAPVVDTPPLVTMAQVDDFVACLPVIEKYLPGRTAPVVQQPSLLSDAERFFSSVEVSASRLTALHEAKTVTDAMLLALPARSPTPDPALPVDPLWEVGKFPKQSKATFKLPQGQKSVFHHHVVPSHSPPIAASDLKLLGRAGPPSKLATSLPDAVLCDWQDNIRRGLESITAADSLCEAASLALFVKNANPLAFSSEASALEVGALMRHLAAAIRFTASSMAVAHTCVLLARRDAILSSPGLDTKANFVTQLRQQPASADSLFGPSVPAFVSASRTDDKEDLLHKLAVQALSPRAKSSSSRGGKRKTPQRAAELPVPKLQRVEPPSYTGRRGQGPRRPNRRMRKEKSAHKNQGSGQGGSSKGAPTTGHPQ